MMVEIEYDRFGNPINASREYLQNGACEAESLKSLAEAEALIKEHNLPLLDTQNWSGETGHFEGYKIVGFGRREIYGTPETRQAIIEARENE